MNDSFRAIVTAAALFLSLRPAAALADQSKTAPAAATPAPAASVSESALLAQAQVDAASGMNQVARDEAQRVLAMDPNNLDALRLLGDVEYRLQQYPAAETAYRAVLARAPDDRNVHNRLGGVYAAEGRIDDAIAQFRLSLPSQEGSLNLVETYAEEGRLKELEAEAQMDMDRAPSDDPYTRQELALVYDAEKRYAESIDLYGQALILKPDFWEAHNGLGIVYDEVGRYDDAILEYRRAIGEKGDCYQCWMNWGVVLINSGDPKGAIEKIQKSLSYNRQFGRAYMDLGVAYDARGDFQKAIELYQQAIVYEPRLPEVYINLGSDYITHGLFNLAEASFVKGIAIFPRDARLHLALGYYYEDRHQYPQAVEQYKLAMTYAPSDPRAKNSLDEVQALMGSGH